MKILKGSGDPIHINEFKRIYQSCHGVLYKEVIVSHELHCAFLYCNLKIEEHKTLSNNSEYTKNEVTLLALLTNQMGMQSSRAKAAEELSKKLQRNCLLYNEE